MPVIGTGVDVVHVPGFAEQWRTPGTKFERVFTLGERADCGGGVTDLQVASLAARWAAKEALIKAWSESMWGTAPVASDEIHQLIEVIKDAWGRPRLALHGHVREALAEAHVFVSLSHDGDHATAFVTLEQEETAVPNEASTDFHSWSWSRAAFVDQILA